MPAWRGARPSRSAAGLFGVIALVTVALPVGVVVPLLAVVVVIGCVLVDLLVAGRARPDGDRVAATTLALTVPVPCSLSARTEAGRPWRIRQPVPPELALDPDEAPGDHLVGTITGRHRGVHELPAAVLRLGGPLGMASCDHAVGRSELVTVLPDLPKARRLAAARRRGQSDEPSRVRSRLGLGTEFESVRDYSPDDDVRHVNWVATSRAGRPMSNQFRVDQNREVLCVVDTGRLMASPVGDLTRLDVALDALTILAVAAEEAGDRVGAIAFDATVNRQLAPRRRGAAALVHALFDLEPTEVESDYERAFVAAGRHRRALVVIFTDILDEAASRSLLAACPTLSRHHTVLVASCRDPDVDDLLSERPGDVRDVVRTAVALNLLEGQARVVDALRSRGVTVVTAPSDRLGTACVSSYLRLKQRARL